MQKCMGKVLVTGLLLGALVFPAMAMAEPAAPESGVAPAASVQAAGNGREEVKAFRQNLQAHREKLQELIKEAKDLHAQLRERRATLRELVQEARENKEKGKLEQLQPLRVEAKNLRDANQALREQRQGLRQELKEAVQARDFKAAQAALLEITRIQTLINKNLNGLLQIADRAIAILD